MEIRIGILNAARELSFESSEAPAAVQKTVAAAIETGTGSLSLTDENGHLYLVPVASLAYVEIGSERPRRVGFVA